jgi:glycosyltransferase involved in cell wall biosynthesis
MPPHPPDVGPAPIRDAPIPSDPTRGRGRRLKVCLASMAPFVGGAEVAAERLAVGLLGAGHDVLVVLGTRGPVQERMERAGLRCVHCPMYLTDKWHWLRYVRARNRLRRVLGRHRPDVIHNNDLPTHQIVSDAARGLGVPRICHHRFPYGGPAIDWLNKFGAERHLFVSRALMDELCRESGRLSDSPRAVVHDGLPLPPLPDGETRQRARARLGLPADRVVAAFTGQVIERKGVAELIRAWMLLPGDRRAAAELLIVGDDLQGRGAYSTTVQHLAAELGCPARFVGFQKDVGAWLAASDIAVVPSHVEPLGNATLEAMSYGLPVVGSAVGGIPEMIVHERTGLLVPPRSPGPLAGALARLIDDEATRRQYGVQGRRRCEERFSLQAHVRGVLDEYERVLAVPVSRACAHEHPTDHRGLSPQDRGERPLVLGDLPASPPPAGCGHGGGGPPAGGVRPHP